jgi:hypothetical protein
MILKSLTLKNFKSIGEEPQTVNFAPITLLFGPNSAGKSTIMKSLLYLHELISTGNANPSKLSRLKDRDIGGFINLINNHDLEKEMVIKFDFLFNESFGPSAFENLYLDESPDFVLYTPFHGVNSFSVSFHIRWSFLLNAPLIVKYSVSFKDMVVAEISNSLDGANKTFHLNIVAMCMDREDDDRLMTESYDGLVGFFSEFVDDAIFSEENSVVSFGVPGKKTLPELGKIIDIGFSSPLMDTYLCVRCNAFISEFIVTPLDFINKYLTEMLYLGPLRVIPSRSNPFELSDDAARWSNGLAAWDVLTHSSEEFVELVSKWFGGEECLNSGYEVKLKKYRELAFNSPLMLALQQGRDDVMDVDWVASQLDKMVTKSEICLWDKRARIELHPQDLGVGISQVLPVIVLAMLRRKSLSCIEQPELHIHPAFQVVLGDLFANAIGFNGVNFKADILEHCSGGDKDLLSYVLSLSSRDIREHLRKCIFEGVLIKEDFPVLRVHGDLFYNRPQFIIETHSEHLMLRLLKRIRQTTDGDLEPGAPELDSVDVSVVYVEPGELSVSIRNIKVNDDGEFVGTWPKGFFAERREELM